MTARNMDTECFECGETIVDGECPFCSQDRKDIKLATDPLAWGLLFLALAVLVAWAGWRWGSTHPAP